MKQCPECHRPYYDETLNFCLEDGTELIKDSAGAEETALFDRNEISEAPTRLQSMGSQNEQNSRALTPEVVLGRRRAVFWLLALLPVLAFGGYLLSRYYPEGSSKQINSIAVLPIANESANADMDYLSDGLTESLIASLSQLPQLSVKARSSVFRYKGADVDLKKLGSDLGVEALLTGRMVQRGQDVRVDIELVEAATEKVLWKADYRRSLRDLAALEDDLSTAITGQLRAKLSGAENERVGRLHTADPDAYELYLRAQHLSGGQDQINRAVDYYKQAIDRDPKYALAYVGLATAYMELGGVHGYESPRDAYPKAYSALQKALELNPDLASAHGSMAQYQLMYGWDWEAARTEFEAAIRLDPNDSQAHEEYGTYLESIGRFEDAVREREIARKLDPLSPGVTADVGYPLYYARRQQEAIDHYRKALEIDPSYPWAFLWIGQSLLETKQYDDAMAQIDKAIEISGGNVMRMIATRGYAYAVVGRRGDALKVIDDLTTLSKTHYVSPYFFAVIYSGLADKEKAFEYLDLAVAERHPYLILTNIEPVFDNLRPDPRFKGVINRIGIPN